MSQTLSTDKMQDSYINRKAMDAFPPRPDKYFIRYSLKKLKLLKIHPSISYCLSLTRLWELLKYLIFMNESRMVSPPLSFSLH